MASTPTEGTVALIDNPVSCTFDALAVFLHDAWWTDAEIGGGAVTGQSHRPEDVVVLLAVGHVPESAR